jgi:hypothetical protein
MNKGREAKPIWHLHPRSRDVTDNMIKVTYENGSVLFIVKRNDRWFVDNDLMPADLREIQNRHRVTNFEVVRLSSTVVDSGYVGSALILEGEADDGADGKKVRCTSVPAVAEIAIVTRPPKNGEDPPIFLTSTA